ncbi:MAG: hypothetical protein ACR2G0_06275 [Chthoniobacterales bacterium]
MSARKRDDDMKSGGRQGRTICITAAQRSGTTALQWAIKAAGVVNFGEIFSGHPAGDASGAFYHFATQHDIRLVDIRTRAETSALTKRYLEWLKDQAAARDLLIDIKLNSWSVLLPWGGYTQREPILLSLLKRQGTAFVFIWRDNLADQLLSQFIANELGIWHNLTEAEVAGRTVTAPLPRLRERARLIMRAEADMLEHLADYPQKIVVQYEELFRDGVLTRPFQDEFREMTEIVLPGGNYPSIRPSSVDKRAVVLNYEEIVAAIRPLAERRREQWMKRRVSP